MTKELYIDITRENLIAEYTNSARAYVKSIE